MVFLKMIEIVGAVAAAVLKFAGALVGLVLILFVLIIAREFAWALRQENKKQMEEKKKNENDGV